MGVTVLIPSTLRQYTERQSNIVLEGKTVREILENLKSRFPALDKQVFSSGVSLNLIFYINDQDTRSLKGMDTPVNEGDALSMILALAGG